MDENIHVPSGEECMGQWGPGQSSWNWWWELGINAGEVVSVKPVPDSGGL